MTLHDALTDFVAAHEVLEKALTAYNGAECQLKVALADRVVVFGDYLIQPTPKGILAVKVVCIPRGIDVAAE